MTCEIIKDLIPMYIDKTASDETLEAVKNHIKDCPDCKRFYKSCKATEERVAKRNLFSDSDPDFKEVQMPEDSYFSFSRKLKKRKNIHTIIAACIFAAMATYIVVDIINSVKGKEK